VDFKNPVERRAQSAVRCSDGVHILCIEKIVTGSNTMRNGVDVSNYDNGVYRGRRHSPAHDDWRKYD
jgi:hypothetical protein